MNEAKIVVKAIFLPSRDSAVVVQPGKESLDSPTATIATQLPTILRGRVPLRLLVTLRIVPISGIVDGRFGMADIAPADLASALRFEEPKECR